MCHSHRYLMTIGWAYKSSTCDVMYTVLSTAPPIYIMVVKFRNTICPPHPPQLSLHRRAALSINSNGTRSVYGRKNPKSSLYCEMSMVTLQANVSIVYKSNRILVHWRYLTSLLKTGISFSLIRFLFIYFISVKIFVILRKWNVNSCYITILCFCLYMNLQSAKIC
jgi:hypothetical protein